MSDRGAQTPLRAPFRECPKCAGLSSVDDVTCIHCRYLLVLSVTDRVTAKHFGGLRDHERPAA